MLSVHKNFLVSVSLTSAAFDIIDHDMYSLGFILVRHQWLCSRSSALHNVYNSSQYSHFISVTIWHTTFSLLSSLRLSGKHHSSPECSHIDHFLDDFWSLILNSSRTEFVLIELKRQLAEIHKPSISIDTTQSAGNLGFIFDEHLSFSDQISALSKSCYHHIRALRCIRPYLNLHTAKTIATSIGHSKLYYFNSLYYGLPKYQINRFKHIQNALARTVVVQAPKFQHITPFLKSLHCLQVSLTDKILKIFWTGNF